MTVITRFAPSPTGTLHIGNIRIALVNWLYAKKYNGRFILRIDDTDQKRSKIEHYEGIIKDLKWLGLGWDSCFFQSSRFNKYEVVKKHLISTGRLYECYETPEMLETERKRQLNSGCPPIYNRKSLQLTTAEKAKLQAKGYKAHYRFLMNNSKPIIWNDLIKGEIKYDSANISDPIVIKEDGTMIYMLCSVIDDIEYKISHIIRGEDHITNTAIQIQMFEALDAIIPQLGHLSLIKSNSGKISKRIGGFTIDYLRDKLSIEPMSINNLLALSGTSNNVSAHCNLESLITKFDLSAFSKSTIIYNENELITLNHKLLINTEYDDIKDQLAAIGLSEVTQEFWLAVRNNLNTLNDIKIWWQICHSPRFTEIQEQDKDFLTIAAKLLPSGKFTINSCDDWIQNIIKATNRSGKALFMPLRLALTGIKHGPELRDLLPLIGEKEVKTRLLR
ncbi:glutamate--tRNA ligase [Orientia chuto str. Dubai]|uniref:Glutamate--tRNA ligase n=1 Tax=Orientia chuto str. Dubai TaxID=1359168 RepID=A0A0F3MGR6_9RICK|nr:glutamate--tRNA ligase [Candidatus Orientia mediorientalis]KJV54662.1 glutamate--tRNA ligase [Orientia chuto str. Dubai]